MASVIGGFAGPAEISRRVRTRRDGRLRSLPVLLLDVHTACNCRCVMCDIWKANADRREIAPAVLDRHVEDIRRLRVRRVVLTGGEPLLHSNLWALCERLRSANVSITLLSTGLLLRAHAPRIAEFCDEVIVSIDGPAAVHDRIRRVPHGFARLADGVAALRDRAPTLRISGRCVIQKENCSVVSEVVDAARALTLDRVSFLPADVTSRAFNRPDGWSPERQGEIARVALQFLLEHRARAVIVVAERHREDQRAGKRYDQDDLADDALTAEHRVSSRSSGSLQDS